jgi:pyrroline-5-carboxylate reductase
MKEQILGFIGAGNMAGSLISGLIADGYPPGAIWVSDIDEDRLKATATRFGVRTTGDNTTVVAHSNVLVLAVKPQVMHALALEIGPSVRARGVLIVSIAAGVGVQSLDRWLGGGTAIVRCMPNMPALVNTGATALHANSRVSREQRDWAEKLMRSVGLTVWVDDESLINAVTALSGSGPAYFFLLMEAMEAAATKLGLDAHTARLLAQQTALGAAKVAIESEESPRELRLRVTSPGGTTERAIATLEQAGFRAEIQEAMFAAEARAVELSKQLGEK